MKELIEVNRLFFDTVMAMVVTTHTWNVNSFFKVAYRKKTLPDM